MFILNTILWVTVTLISPVKVLAADDPGEIVDTLDHGLIKSRGKSAICPKSSGVLSQLSVISRVNFVYLK